MSAAALIRQPDLTRIFKAAKAADYPVSVTIEQGGKIVILPVSAKDAPVANPWDEDDDEA